MLTHLFEEVSPRPLGLARILIGVAAIIRAFIALPELLDISRTSIVNTPYASWLPEPSVALAITLVSAWVVAAILFTIGWKVSVSGSALLLSIVSALVLDQQLYGNHLYLLAWLVLLLTIAGAGSGLSWRRGDTQVVRWPVLLLMAQLSIVYGFAGLTKLNSSFLSGEVLAGSVGGGLIGFPDALRTPRFLGVMAALAVFVELFVAVFIWRRRFRPAAFVLGLALHLSITLLMSIPLKLLVFSIEMLALYPLFLDHEKLVLVWDDTCGYCRTWVRFFKRLDVLRVLEPIGASDTRNQIPEAEVRRAMHLNHHGETSRGFRAVVLTLEHLVPTLWVAPILRLPGISHMGEKWYRRQARRRSCQVGEGRELSRGSTAG